ncbi:MAG: GtrA family protein [Acetobacteraceae bacterium]|nr:GtrA family protein [Acetobacteraceae bacterium]
MPIPTAPAALRRRLTLLAGEAFRFGLVGLAGYVVDVAVLEAVVRAGTDPFTARVPSFLAAASVTWYLNRRFTFRGPEARQRPVRHQWPLFVALMLPGAALNYGTYALMVAQWDLARNVLALPVAAGALAGMTTNFLASKLIVFRA